MSEVIVDARGQLCPQPLIETKKALDEHIVGTEFVVLVDNETSCQNIERFLRDNGMAATIAADGSEFILRFTKTRVELAAPDAAAYCTPTGRMDYVVVLSSDVVGSDEVLGRRLVKGLLTALKVVEPMPTHLILYSRGVLLARQEADTLPDLIALAARGIQIRLCGTCVEHYDLKGQIGVGEIADMLTLMELQLKAGKVLKP